MLASLGCLLLQISTDASTAWWGTLFANGIIDTGLLGIASDSVVGALQVANGDSHEKMAEDARSVCYRARWARHRAAQMLVEAEELGKDAEVIKATMEAYLANIEASNADLQSGIDAENRIFRPKLLVTVIGAVGVIVIFVVAAVIKGRALRQKLGDLGSLEARIRASAHGATTGSADGG